MQSSGKSLSYLTKEGLHNVWVNRMMSLASVAVLTSCLTIIGCAAMLFFNVAEMLDKVGDQNVIMVFVEDNADEATTEQVGEDLKKIENVGSVTFVPREESWEEQVESLGESAGILEGLKNPLPDAYEVTVDDLELFDSTVEKVSKVENVQKVRENSVLAAQISALSRSVGFVSLGIIVLLFLVSLFIISNTVRITMYNRRLEISIMKAVGATNSFIRWPFMIEGIVLGIIAAVVSLGLVAIIYTIVSSAFSTFVSALSMSLLSFSGYWWQMLLCFVAVGVLTGVFGSAVSMRRYLTEQKGESDEI